MASWCDLEVRMRRACEALCQRGKPYKATEVELLWLGWAKKRGAWFCHWD